MIHINKSNKSNISPKYLPKISGESHGKKSPERNHHRNHQPAPWTSICFLFSSSASRARFASSSWPAPNGVRKPWKIPVKNGKEWLEPGENHGKQRCKKNKHRHMISYDDICHVFKRKSVIFCNVNADVMWTRYIHYILRLGVNWDQQRDIYISARATSIAFGYQSFNPW